MGSLVCPLCCGRSFANKKSLKYHLLTWETNISCPACKRRFQSVRELADHLDLETCEQVAFVIHVNNTPDPHGKLIAFGRGEYSEKPNAKKHHSVGIQQNKHLTLKTVQKEVLAKPQKPPKDNTSPVDVSTHGEESVLIPHCVSPVSETVDKLEQEFLDELEEHYCNSCNCVIHGVREHIQQFHSNEMVILQDVEEDDKSVVVMETGEDADSDSFSYELYTDTDVAKEEVDNMQEVDNDVSMELDVSTVVERMSDTRTKYIHNSTARKSSVKDQGSKVVKDSPISKSLDSRPSTIKRPSKHKAISLNVCVTGEEKTSNVTCHNSETPHGQVVIETDFLQNKRKDCDTGSPTLIKRDKDKTMSIREKQLETKSNTSMSKANKTLVKESNADNSASTPTIKVPPKLKKHTLIQAHIIQLLHSKGLDELKQSIADSSSGEASNEDVLQRLFTAANEYLGDSSPNNILGDGQNSHIESTPKIKEEERNVILKFTSDPLDINAIPIFQCDSCNFEFSTAHLFAAHKCKFPKTVALTLCELCGIKCKSNRDLQLHLQTHDPTSITNKLFQKQVKRLLSVPVTCDVCKTEFTSDRGLKVHQRMHRPDNIQKVAEMNNKVEYQCDICNAIVYSQRTLRIHSKVHFNTESDKRPRQPKLLGSQPSNRKVGVLTCKLCQESFSSNADLKTHWQDQCSIRFKSLPACVEEIPGQINVGSELFTCKICGEQVAESLRSDHKQTHAGDTPFVCRDCNHPFFSEMDLNFHMSVHNTDVELACLTCKTKFTDATLLKLHMKIHAGADQPYPCGFCGKYFSKPHEKVKHERVHTGEKPYECKTCGMRFRVSYLLNVHSRIHSGIRPYTCKQCSKTFRSSSNYFRHIRIHSNVRAYACPYCPKKFKTGVQLAGHKKCHTKPYICPQCGRSFAAVYALRVHVTTHNKHNHNCHICGAAYARAYALGDHMKTHGENIPVSPEEEEDHEMDVANDVVLDY